MHKYSQYAVRLLRLADPICLHKYGLACAGQISNIVRYESKNCGVEISAHCHLA